MAKVDSDDEATLGVAGMSEMESHSVAGEEAEEDRRAVAEETEEDETVPDKAVAGEAREWEENTTNRMVDDEFVPEMAQDCNWFRLDWVKKEDSIPDPLIPSCVDGLVRLREASLEREGVWPALGNPVKE